MLHLSKLDINNQHNEEWTKVAISASRLVYIVDTDVYNVFLAFM